MKQTINELVADILGLDPTVVTGEFSRETADNWDSLNHLRIITAVEQAFAVTLSMREIEAVTGVEQLAEIVARKAPGARSSPQSGQGYGREK